MSGWFTADLHFGHANIIEYCARPFDSVEAMNEGLIGRWNEVVDHDDTVWVLGDVAMGHIVDTLPLVGKLNGRKLLLAGNHDRCWIGHGAKSSAWIERYLDAGFAEVHQGQMHLEVGDTSILACHFPYRGDSQEQDRFLEARPVDAGEWLLHGHVHERWRQHDRMINVGVDAWDCRPVSEAELQELISNGPTDLAALSS